MSISGLGPHGLVKKTDYQVKRLCSEVQMFTSCNTIWDSFVISFTVLSSTIAVSDFCTIHDKFVLASVGKEMKEHTCEQSRGFQWQSWHWKSSYIGSFGMSGMWMTVGTQWNIAYWWSKLWGPETAMMSSKLNNNIHCCDHHHDQHILVFSNLMSLSAGWHHLSVPSERFSNQTVTVWEGLEKTQLG